MSAAETSTAAAVSHWINGKPVAASSGRIGAVTNPATGQIVAEVGFAGIEDVDRAVAAAKAASLEWRSTPLSRRAEVSSVYTAWSPRTGGAWRRSSALRMARPWSMRSARWRADLRTWSLPVVFPTCSRAATLSKRATASMSTRYASRSVWWPASRPSTSP